jgi:hypothetical protein
MDSIDEKIREILDTVIPRDGEVDGMTAELHDNAVDNTLAKIHAAFTEEGYVQVPKEVQETWKEYNRMAGYMTGQEWYDRFEELVEEMNMEPPIVDGAYLEAAQRASGIDNE